MPTKKTSLPKPPVMAKKAPTAAPVPGSGAARPPVRHGPHGGRPRGNRVPVWMTEDERTEIARRAGVAGLSLSAYLRAAGMNHPIRSQYDYEAVRALVAVAGDLGRLGGLMKLWLGERRGEGAAVKDVNTALQEARKLQDTIRGMLGRV